MSYVSTRTMNLSSIERELAPERYEKRKGQDAKGELYDPVDPQLSSERRRARLLLKALNDTTDERQEERARLIIFATSSGMVSMSCIVPVWWSINSKAESPGVKLGILVVIVCSSGLGRTRATSARPQLDENGHSTVRTFFSLLAFLRARLRCNAVKTCYAASCRIHQSL